MKVRALLLLLILMSCTHHPERYVASEVAPIVLGEVDITKSLLKKFRYQDLNLPQRALYLELRNSKNALVDIAEDEIRIKYRRQTLAPKIERISPGKYELTIPQVDNLSLLHVEIQKKKLKHSLQSLQIPHKSTSKIELLANEHHLLKFRLTLRDKSSSPVETQNSPEIILEGLGQVNDFQQIKKGVWEFTVVHPEVNQIFYLSVRGNGMLLERLFRFQHVEK